MSAIDLMHIANFHIRTNEIGHNKLATVPSLIRLMQEASMQQVIKLKLSTWDMEAEKLSWVILKKDIKIVSLPRLNDIISVATYPSKFDKYFAYRDYKVYAGNNELLATASSQWSLLDTQKRKMAQMPQRFLEMDAPKGNVLDDPDVRLRPLSSYDSSRAVEVKYFDLDWNGHLNNGILTRYILENLPASIWDQQITRLKLLFKTEATLGDKLTIQVKQQESLWSFQVFNETRQKITALSEAVFNGAS